MRIFWEGYTGQPGPGSPAWDGLLPGALAIAVWDLNNYLTKFIIRSREV
jgi:hypothetical protein